MKSKLNSFQNDLYSLKENWSKDMLSGFLVSLIALPLCLGIAGASGFPPIMGVLTAIVGGMVVSIFAGSELTIKGPAAGLIVIVAGCVEELGKGNQELGWHLTLGVIVVAAVVQIILGAIKVASVVDFFPLSAVHGMLAAIGIIIISKQFHFAVGIAPSELKGKEPLDLLLMIPHSITHLTPQIAIIGGISLAILLGLPYINNKLVKRIPPALLVLIVGVILDKLFSLDSDTYKNLKPLVNPGTLSLSWNASFDALSSDTIGIFIKYVIMFAVIGSLESLLTGKAIDLIEVKKRKSDLSKDLVAVGIGNIISGLLGGLPMISEVARSSANINNGGQTRWANFFHGVFLLLFVVLVAPLIKLIPVASLAAMLIFVGIKLASPKEFKHVYHIGKEQIVIFLITIIVTISTDLLLGIAAGILVKFISHIIHGASIKSLFKAEVSVTTTGNEYCVSLKGSGVFSNWLLTHKKLLEIPSSKTIILDVNDAKFLDHTFMENLYRFIDEYELQDGKFKIIGLESFKELSKAKTCARVNLSI
ncbi:MAG: SulP family inorganic anion transporter [Bacteroidetes bacterium]|nr:SulP family inorganic anion transporter [Bacteroidota bacterium]